MATRAVTALFDNQDTAARVIDRIEAEGVPHSDIGIVSPMPRPMPRGSGAVAPWSLCARTGRSPIVSSP